LEKHTKKDPKKSRFIEQNIEQMKLGGVILTPPSPPRKFYFPRPRPENEERQLRAGRREAADQPFSHYAFLSVVKVG